MSYGRMREKACQLREEVHYLLTQAEATDTEEGGRYGADRRGDALPAELQRRETRLKRIREAKRALEVRVREGTATAGPPPEAAQPDDKAQYNFTDPESRIMKGPPGTQPQATRSRTFRRRMAQFFQSRTQQHRKRGNRSAGPNVCHAWSALTQWP